MRLECVNVRTVVRRRDATNMCVHILIQQDFVAVEDYTRESVLCFHPLCIHPAHKHRTPAPAKALAGSHLDTTCVFDSAKPGYPLLHHRKQRPTRPSPSQWRTASGSLRGMAGRQGADAGQRSRSTVRMRSHRRARSAAAMAALAWCLAALSSASAFMPTTSVSAGGSRRCRGRHARRSAPRACVRACVWLLCRCCVCHVVLPFVMFRG